MRGEYELRGPPWLPWFGCVGRGRIRLDQPASQSQSQRQSRVGDDGVGLAGGHERAERTLWIAYSSLQLGSAMLSPLPPRPLLSRLVSLLGGKAPERDQNHIHVQTKNPDQTQTLAASNPILSFASYPWPWVAPGSPRSHCFSLSHTTSRDKARFESLKYHPWA